ncbi:MAG: phosphoenolpyruvate carboxykinase (ATP) [Chitinophagaceae bacterium]|nr:MAG: phosphoenolpyruvate carboxykinase (ATP) [Chitinophagaceae bacterium]
MGVLSNLGINTAKIHVNFSSEELIKLALETDDNSALSDTEALMVYSGKKTGRSPKDKRIVVEESTKENINWGEVNMPIDAASFEQSKVNAIHFFNQCKELYVLDGYAVWDKENRIKVRVICTKAYHALFMFNMLIRPSQQELETFGTPDYILYNAGATVADLSIKGITSNTSIQLSFEKKEILIFGTEYAGEMKKAIFSLLNYLMPLKQNLSMHCSANESAKGEVSLFFGLSGTGKTTLSADPHRKLIGDDEHIWNDHGISNIEGGCYAKVINLESAKEPEIYQAIRKGTILENVVYDPASNKVDYTNQSITENTRAAYPIEFISNAKIPCIGKHPNHIIFLTCDAFGVLPPISSLDSEQAQYHFISGYTAKVAGTEMGVTEPVATFSSCFGAAFMVWKPIVYAKLLAEKMNQHQTKVWLINTGWIGGGYGVGKRINLAYTRAMINAIHENLFQNVTFHTEPYFNLSIPESCPEIPNSILNPIDAWSNKDAYVAQAKKLKNLFDANYLKFQ